MLPIVAIAAPHSKLRVIRIPDAGHFPWMDDPGRVVSEIDRFLAA